MAAASEPLSRVSRLIPAGIGTLCKIELCQAPARYLVLYVDGLWTRLCDVHLHLNGHA